MLAMVRCCPDAIEWLLPVMGGFMALRGLALSSWLSGCGLLLLLREIKQPYGPIPSAACALCDDRERPLTMHLFAATLALSSGSTASALIGLATLANAFGRHVRKEMKEYYRATDARRIIPPMVAPPGWRRRWRRSRSLSSQRWMSRPCGSRWTLTVEPMMILLQRGEEDPP